MNVLCPGPQSGSAILPLLDPCQNWSLGPRDESTTEATSPVHKLLGFEKEETEKRRLGKEGEGSTVCTEMVLEELEDYSAC